MNAREYIEPCIYRRAGRYVVVVKANGTQHSETLPLSSTLREARALRTKLQGIAQAGLVIPSSKSLTGDILTAWLQDFEQTTPSRNTLKAYRLDIGYWQPLIGKVRIKDLRAVIIENGRDSLELGPKSVKNALGTLKTALNWAVEHELISRNVALAVKPPAVPRFTSHWANEDEAYRLLEAFTEDGAPYGYMLAVGLLTCLRTESEWGGMRWRDVHKRLKTASLVSVRLQDGTVIPAGNDKHKRRLLEPSDEAMRFLDLQQKWQAKARDLYQAEWEVNDPEGIGYVFTTMYGQRIQQATLQRHLNRITAKLGIPHMRVHDLRHSGATLLLGAGVHVKVVSDLLGHSSIKVTLDTYGHAVPGLARAAANQLGEMLKPRKDAQAQ